MRNATCVIHPGVCVRVERFTCDLEEYFDFYS